MIFWMLTIDILFALINRFGQLERSLRPIQEGWLRFRQMALRLENQQEHPKLSGHFGER